MSRIDRSVLEQDGVRKAVREAGHGHLLLSEAALAESVARTLAARSASAPVWVFGYASLIWSPTFHFVERRLARVHGYHRGFYLWSRVNRGSLEYPGLVLALDRGGACSGVAFRLNEADVVQELTLIWRREMVLGAYVPRWVSADTQEGALRAIAFVVDRSKPGYAGRLSEEQIVATALKAHGHYGTCADYLLATAASLEQHGIADRRLSRLARRLEERRESDRRATPPSQEFLNPG